MGVLLPLSCHFPEMKDLAIFRGQATFLGGMCQLGELRNACILNDGTPRTAKRG